MIKDPYKTVKDDYNSIDFKYHQTYNPILEFSAEVADFSRTIAPNSRLLLIGAVPVEVVHFHTLTSNIVCLDISETMISYIRHSHPHLKTKVENLMNYEDSEPYTHIWTCRTLIHIPPKDLEKALARLKHLLQVGGMLGTIFFTTQEKYKEEVIKEKYTNQNDIYYYRTLYSVEHLTQSFETVGLVVEKTITNADKDNDASVYFRAMSER